MKVKVKLLSHVGLFATPWTVAYQAPPSMGFSRQKYWSGVPSASREFFESWVRGGLGEVESFEAAPVAEPRGSWSQALQSSVPTNVALAGRTRLPQ